MSRPHCVRPGRAHPGVAASVPSNIPAMPGHGVPGRLTVLDPTGRGQEWGTQPSRSGSGRTCSASAAEGEARHAEDAVRAMASQIRLTPKVRRTTSPTKSIAGR